MARIVIVYCPERVGSKGRKKALECSILGTVKSVEAALLASGHTVGHAVFRRDIKRFINAVRGFKPDCIFNLCETISGDNALEKNAAAVYEILGIPFTGNGFLALGVCQNKEIAKNLLRAQGIPTPDFVVCREAGVGRLPFSLPAIVKPLFEDGSCGITSRSVVKSAAALRRRVRHVLKVYRQPALVEEFVDGREMQVSLLGNGEPDVLAVAELSYEGLPKRLPRICSYSAKWEHKSDYYKFTRTVVPAEITAKSRKKLEKMSRKIFRSFGLRGYARIDLRLRRKEPFVIEVNPNPDISEDAGFEKAARHAGFSYTGIIDRIVRCALE